MEVHTTSLIQARFGENAFPISRLIVERAGSLALSRSALVSRLGYRHLAKGHRALSELLLTGVVPPLAAQNLASALEIDQRLLDDVIAATAQQRRDIERGKAVAEEESYRKAFRPHLQVQTERQVPSPIWLAAILGLERLWIVELPDTNVETVRASISEHYRSRRGHMAAFGAITGYVLVLVPGYRMDFGIPYAPDGSRLGKMRSVLRLGKAVLRL